MTSTSLTNHRLDGSPEAGSEAAALALALIEQSPGGARRATPVLYVHGGTFASELSVFFRFDGASWADALNARGFSVFGLDFAGYGRSERFQGMHAQTPGAGAPLGRAEGATTQIARAVARIRALTGALRVALVAHSWGTIPAARYAIERPAEVDRLVVFGPILARDGDAPPPTLGPWRLLTAADQYKRFVEDVPPGEPPVLGRAHFAIWAEAWLATDRHGRSAATPAVRVPSGPIADIASMWRGARHYDPARLAVPILNIRGAWDSLSTDADARRFMGALTSAPAKEDVVIERATHLMHLESGRRHLYDAVGRFLSQRVR